MDKHFLKSYVELLIKTCHRRGIHAMGGMAAQIPIKNDPSANEKALEKVRQDKLREVNAGHDGTWWLTRARADRERNFDVHMKGPNQIKYPPRRRTWKRAGFAYASRGEITGARSAVEHRCGLQYLESWLRDQECVPNIT